MEMNSTPWSPVLRYATHLAMNSTPVSTIALQHKSVSSVLRYAKPLPINRTPVSTVGGRTQGHFLHSAIRQALFRLFRPRRLAPDEHDAFQPSQLALGEDGAVSSILTHPVSYRRTG